MLKKSCISGIFCFLAVMVIPLKIFAVNRVSTGSRDYISVEDAFKKGLINLSILGKGGHTAECIGLEIVNRYPDTLFLKIEPGRQLVSEDTLVQDILITRKEKFFLAAGKKKALNIYGFCCESSRSSPVDSSLFSVGHMADPNLVALACFLNEHDFPVDAALAAVWVISDNHPVSSIDSDNPEQVKELREFVSKLKGVEVPWYSSEYIKSEDVLFTGITTTIKGDLAIYIPHNCMVSICIADSEGRIVGVLDENVLFNPGTYRFTFTLHVSDWKRGKYYYRLYADGSILKQKEFDI
jgi:hypothetical protein